MLSFPFLLLIIELVKMENSLIYLKDNEIPECIDKSGLKIFYIFYKSKSPRYEDHIKMLQFVCEERQSVEVFILEYPDGSETENLKKLLKEEVSGNEEGRKRNFEFVIYFGKKLVDRLIDCSTSAFTKKLRMINESEFNGNPTREDGLTDEVVERIEKLLNENNVILFMKGEKYAPQCKFSRAITEILNDVKLKYNTYDILKDLEVRNELKIYSDWPTYPQLYVDKKLIGGFDIVREMYEDGQLTEVIPSKYFETS